MRHIETHKPGQSKTEYYIHESVGELVEFAKAVPQHRYHAFDHANAEHSSFTGRRFADWSAVWQATQTAWQDGIAVLERMLAEISDAVLPKPVSRKRKSQFREDDGDELDYDRLRTGQAFWRTTRRTNTKGPATITVLVDVCANARVNHTDILWRGAAAIALTKILEQAGYRVELWAVEKTRGLWGARGEIDGMQAVCLKRPSDVLDCSTLIGAVSAWFFRTVLFRVDCCGQHQIDSGLGHHAVPNSNDLDEITPDRNRHLVADAFTYDAAVAKVRQVLNTLTQGTSK
jgi:hypothetical protein